VPVSVRLIGSFGGSSGTSITIPTTNKPVVGEILYCVILQDSDGTVGTLGNTLPSGWVKSGADIPQSGTTPFGKAFIKNAAVSGDTTVASYTFGVSTGASMVGFIIAISGNVDTTTPIKGALVSGTTAMPSISGAIVGDAYVYGMAAYGATTFTHQTAGDKLGDALSSWIDGSIGEFTVTSAGSITRTITASGTSPRRFAVLFGQVTSVAPTVDAGTDATIDQYDTFSRSPASEDDGGATITARSWSVVSGPNQVGATLATTAALSWAPTVGGTYVLRYSATNSQGTDTDDVTVTVNSLVFPVTAPLVLGADRAVAKNVTTTRSANLPLAASAAGVKDVAYSPSAPLLLGASAEGMKINLVVAPLKIAAALLNAGSSNGSFPTAPMKLAASIAGREHLSGAGVVTAPLPLAASVDTSSVRAGTVTAPIVMGASLSGVVKSVSVTRAAPVTLAASISDIGRNADAAPNAHLLLAASTAGHVHTGGTVARTAPLKIKALRTTSSVHFGHAGVLATPLRLKTVVFGERIVEEAKSLRPKADTTVKYEVVCVARVPQVSGSPTFIEVDPIDWTSITHNQVLNNPDSVSIEVKVEKLTEPILQRLRTPHELPTEIWIRRNGKQVFAGPLLGGSVSGEALSLEAQGIEAYAKMWFVASDLDFQNVDQCTIAVTLINQWQTLDYGNFGIDTSQAGVSGVLRTLALPAAELHNVYERINDFTSMADGFDWSIDPASRMLELYSPQRGVDRSFGEDAIIFDQRNVTSSDLAFSVSPGDLASDGLATATASGSDTPLVATFANSELRARYGRTGVTANFQSPDQGALDAATQALVQARGAVLLIPGPNARVTIDSDLSSYDVGDTIGYQAHSRLSVSGAYRIRKRVVRVAETGTESVSLEFV
jgi:hypothetical protein